VIRVAVNGRFLGQRITGVQRHARELLRAMDALVTSTPAIGARFSLSVLTPRGISPTLPLSSIPIRQVGSLRGQLWEQLELARHAVGVTLLNLCNTAPLASRSMVATIHDVSVYAVPEAYSTPFRMWYRFMLPRLGRRARRIVTVSNFSRRELERYIGVSSTDITVISGSGEHILAQPADFRILERMSLRSRGYVVAVGSHSPHKNLAGVAEAARQLGAQGIDTVISGGTNTEVFGSHPVAEHPHLRFAGYVSDAELRALYEHAACLLYPSFYEGFGLPPLEAMSCCCPVVAARAASLPEACGDAAVYCDPADFSDIARAVQSVVGDSAMQEELRRRGVERARRFTWAGAATAMFNLLDQLQP
jgi:glycosyltransferase involved in cell wall biosynthesis